jgi:hypothetical protein
MSLWIGPQFAEFIGDRMRTGDAGDHGVAVSAADVAHRDASGEPPRATAWAEHVKPGIPAIRASKTGFSGPQGCPGTWGPHPATRDTMSGQDWQEG